MADVVHFQDMKQQRTREEQEMMTTALRELLNKVEAGEVVGITFAAIFADRQTLWISALHGPACGFHELVGASTILATHVAAATDV